ncbi:hypothetical protein C2H92_18550 [Bacillus halotolerans]|nr:hypothetical protein C2H92_18550 [Bacillus halotolerans]
MARLAFIFGEILLRNESLSSLYADFANIYIGTGSGNLYFIVIRSSFQTNRTAPLYEFAAPQSRCY